MVKKKRRRKLRGSLTLQYFMQAFGSSPIPDIPRIEKREVECEERGKKTRQKMEGKKRDRCRERKDR